MMGKSEIKIKLVTRWKPINKSASNTQGFDCKNNQIVQDIMKTVTDTLRNALINSVLNYSSFCWKILSRQKEKDGRRGRKEESHTNIFRQDL